jgi:hypothetical protein
MIRAEGEQVPSVQPRGPPQAEPVAFSPPPPAANFAAVQRPAAQQQMMSSAPPPPPPPPGGNNKFAQQKPQQQPAAAATGGRQDEAGHRQKLLNEIRGGVRLRHVQTVDKSGLVLSEEEQQQLLRAGTPNGSLDSQGFVLAFLKFWHFNEFIWASQKFSLKTPQGNSSFRSLTMFLLPQEKPQSLDGCLLAGLLLLRAVPLSAGHQWVALGQLVACPAMFPVANRRPGPTTTAEVQSASGAALA